MYKVKKTMEISASHSLHFSRAGIDEPMHGHNWTVTVWCRSEELDEDGLVVDFLDIERRIRVNVKECEGNEASYETDK